MYRLYLAIHVAMYLALEVNRTLCLSDSCLCRSSSEIFIVVCTGVIPLSPCQPQAESTNGYVVRCGHNSNFSYMYVALDRGDALDMNFSHAVFDDNKTMQVRVLIYSNCY